MQTRKIKAAQVDKVNRTADYLAERQGGVGKAGDRNAPGKAKVRADSISTVKQRVPVNWQSPLANAPFSFTKTKRVPQARHRETKALMEDVRDHGLSGIARAD